MRLMISRKMAKKNRSQGDRFPPLDFSQSLSRVHRIDRARYAALGGPFATSMSAKDRPPR